jgi:serine/threonine protein kinase
MLVEFSVVSERILAFLQDWRYGALESGISARPRRDRLRSLTRALKFLQEGFSDAITSDENAATGGVGGGGGLRGSTLIRANITDFWNARFAEGVVPARLVAEALLSVPEVSLWSAAERRAAASLLPRDWNVPNWGNVPLTSLQRWCVMDNIFFSLQRYRDDDCDYLGREAAIAWPDSPLPLSASPWLDTSDWNIDETKFVFEDAAKPTTDVLGTVSKARYGATRVAVKELMSGKVKDVAAFGHVCRMLRRLRHPSLLQFYGASTKKNRVLLAWEGEAEQFLTLDKVLHSTPKRRMTENHRVSLLAQVASGMAYLHSSLCVHGFLYPGSVVLTDDLQTAKVYDMGLVHGLDDVLAQPNTAKTRLRYLAPELFDLATVGSFQVFARADVYSFAIVMWETLTGTVPFPEFGEDAGLVRQHVCEQREHPSPELKNETLQSLLDVCWVRNPEQRPGFQQIMYYLGCEVQRQSEKMREMQHEIQKMGEAASGRAATLPSKRVIEDASTLPRSLPEARHRLEEAPQNGQVTLHYAKLLAADRQYVHAIAWGKRADKLGFSDVANMNKWRTMLGDQASELAKMSKEYIRTELVMKALKENRYDEALKCYEVLERKKLSLSKSVLKNKAMCYHKMGDFLNAIIFYREYLIVNPTAKDERVLLQSVTKDAVQAFELRGVSLRADYQAVFDVFALRFGLTGDMINSVRDSRVFNDCVEGVFDSAVTKVMTPYAVPHIVLKFFVPLASQLRTIASALEPDDAFGDLPSMIATLKDLVSKFIRSASSIAKCCPKFYLSFGFEWLIAQLVEFTALMSCVSEVAYRSASVVFTELPETCRWVLANVAFMFCLSRGTLWAEMLAAEYEKGMAILVQGADAQSEVISRLVESGKPPQLSEFEITADGITKVCDALRQHVALLEQQESTFVSRANAVPGFKPYPVLLDLLFEPGLKTVTALCVSDRRLPEVETVIEPLYRTFCAANREEDLMTWAMEQEMGIEKLKDLSLLFRLASPATRLLRVIFFSSDGAEYLRGTLGATLRKLAKLKFGLELDAFRLPDGLTEKERNEFVRKSGKRLIKLAEEVLQSVLKSVDAIPPAIRKFLLNARSHFKKINDVEDLVATRLVVVGLFFLRFICPALVTPQVYGLCDFELTPEVQRGLILLGKVVQNATSNVEFAGDKEPYMQACNGFVTKTQDLVTKIFKQIIDPQAVGILALRIRRDTSRQKKGRTDEQQDKDRVGAVRDCAVLVNEFGMKRSFFERMEKSGASAETMHAVRRMVEEDAALHRIRSNRCKDILAAYLKKEGDAYTWALRSVVSELGEVLPAELKVFGENEFVTGPHNYESSDTTPNLSLTQSFLMLDCVTASDPVRTLATAKVLRTSCQEAWEAGSVLESLVGQAEQIISVEVDASAAATSTTTATLSGDDSLVRNGSGGGFGRSSAPSNMSSSFSVDDEDSVGGGSSMTSYDESEDSIQTIGAARQPLKKAHSSTSGSGGGSFLTTRKKARAHLKDQALETANTFKATALVVPQALGLLYFLSALLEDLSLVTFENRDVAETKNIEQEVSRCLSKYYALARRAGSQILAVAATDPGNPLLGSLATYLANSSVLITRAVLAMANVDRALVSWRERKDAEMRVSPPNTGRSRTSEEGSASNSPVLDGSGGLKRSPSKVNNSSNQNRSSGFVTIGKRTSAVKMDDFGGVPLPSGGGAQKQSGSNSSPQIARGSSSGTGSSVQIPSSTARSGLNASSTSIPSSSSTTTSPRDEQQPPVSKSSGGGITLNKSPRAQEQRPHSKTLPPQRDPSPSPSPATSTTTTSLVSDRNNSRVIKSSTRTLDSPGLPAKSGGLSRSSEKSVHGGDQNGSVIEIAPPRNQKDSVVEISPRRNHVNVRLSTQPRRQSVAENSDEEEEDL